MPEEEITEEWLDQHVGWFTTECCCYNNTFIFDEVREGEPASGWCCDEPNPVCYTESYITVYATIPIVTSGERNVDADHDNKWDVDHYFSTVTAMALCFCNHQFVGPCYEEPQVFESKPVFVCSSEGCD